MFLLWRRCINWTRLGRVCCNLASYYIKIHKIYLLGLEYTANGFTLTTLTLYGSCETTGCVFDSNVALMLPINGMYVQLHVDCFYQGIRYGQAQSARLELSPHWLCTMKRSPQNIQPGIDCSCGLPSLTSNQSSWIPISR